ncbi:MAG: VanZ family protein [Clostridiales bacterium]|nr:VanZ family protein [Clostridiales bacterium]
MLNVIFIAYIAILTYFLFFSERYGRDTGLSNYRYNLTLFKELSRFITYRKQLGLESFIVNIFGNILAFTPFGILLPVVSPDNRKFINVGLLTLQFSFTIELLQLIFKVGIFDVDDLFMNTLGGILGYLIFKGFYVLGKRILNRSR